VNQGLRSANHNPLTHNYAIEDALKAAHLKDTIDFVKLLNALMNRMAKVIHTLIRCFTVFSEVPFCVNLRLFSIFITE
jgi:Na+(H+)/acetate symporter ActP